MFDHVTVRVSDRDAAERLYGAALGALGIAQTGRDDEFVQWGGFSIAGGKPGKPATRRLHVGFVAPSRERVDAFHAAGRAAGGFDDGAPGPRPEYRDDYYGGFLRDEDGNSIEAVVHGALRRDGHVDHLWVRVADLAAARRFYDTIAPFARIELAAELPERIRYRSTVGAGGSLTLVQGGQPTEGLHLAFPALDAATVEAFHAAAVAAGYADDGAPGPRPQYAPGYFGAFVLDVDGNSVELVHHGAP
ncbi:MAG TPA: VOC family protein [Conexibacter sp.]|nr:VOC family protein [Conexibacter sp.]